MNANTGYCIYTKYNPSAKENLFTRNKKTLLILQHMYANCYLSRFHILVGPGASQVLLPQVQSSLGFVGGNLVTSTVNSDKPKLVVCPLGRITRHLVVNFICLIGTSGDLNQIVYLFKSALIKHYSKGSSSLPCSQDPKSSAERQQYRKQHHRHH